MITQGLELTDEMLINILKEDGRTQYNIAKLAGVANNTLTNWKRKGLPNQIFELLAVLNVCGYDLKIVKEE